MQRFLIKLKVYVRLFARARFLSEGSDFLPVLCIGARTLGFALPGGLARVKEAGHRQEKSTEVKPLAVTLALVVLAPFVQAPFVHDQGCPVLEVWREPTGAELSSSV